MREYSLALDGLRIFNSNRIYKRIIFTLVPLFLVGLVFSFFTVEDSTQGFLFCLAIFSMVIVVLPMAIKKRFFLFEPIVFVSLSVLFGLCLKTFYVVFGFESNRVVQFRLMDGLSLESMVWSSFVLFLGLMCFTCGYLIHDKPVRMRAMRITELPSARLTVISVVIVVISLVAFLVLVQNTFFSFNSLSDLSQKRFQFDGVDSGERLSNLNYYFYRVALIVKGPMYLLFYKLISERLRYMSVIGILFLLCLTLNMVIPFYISNKAGLILPLADLTIMYYIITGSVKWRTIFLFSIAVLALVSVVAAFRGGESVAGYSLADKVFGGRYFIGVTKSAHIINAFPGQIEYFYGRSLVGWLNIFLPESLEFDNIYFAGLGQFLGSNIFGYQITGVPPGIIPELFMNFGVVGVVIGMYLLGAFMVRAHVALLSRVQNVRYLIFYAIVTVRVPTFLFNNGITVALLKVLADIIIVWLCLILVQKRFSRW